MAAITRIGDSCTGHGDFPPRNSTSGSTSVFINGIGAHRHGDGWASHCNTDPVCHGGALSGGSSSVFVNGQRIGRVGDAVNCGSSVATGSPNVFAGD